MKGQNKTARQVSLATRRVSTATPLMTEVMGCGPLNDNKSTKTCRAVNSPYGSTENCSFTPSFSTYWQKPEISPMGCGVNAYLCFSA